MSIKYNIPSCGNSIRNYINISTKLKTGELDQKTNVHKNFKNYDHSLEIDRWSLIAGDSGIVEMGNLTSEDVAG